MEDERKWAIGPRRTRLGDRTHTSAATRTCRTVLLLGYDSNFYKGIGTEIAAPCSRYWSALQRQKIITFTSLCRAIIL